MEPADRMVSMAPHDHGRDLRSTGECVRSDERRVPGDVAMWAFILAELLVFALLWGWLVEYAAMAMLYLYDRRAAR